MPASPLFLLVILILASPVASATDLPPAPTTTPDVAPPVRSTEAVPPLEPPPTDKLQPRTERQVAVLDVKGVGSADAIAQAITTVLTAEVGALPNIKAISRNELKAIVSHQADASLVGCEAVGCMADIAKLVDADLLVTGTLDVADSAYVLSFTVIDPAGPRVVERQQFSWHGKPEGMLDAVRPYVDRLFAGPDAAGRTGSLEVFADDGALIVVDGKEVGRAPLSSPVRDLPTGVHALEVSKEGYDAYKGEMVVARGESSIARIALVEQPIYAQWWFWPVTGGAALAVAGAGAGLTAYGIYQASLTRGPHLILDGAAQ